MLKGRSRSCQGDDGLGRCFFCLKIVSKLENDVSTLKEKSVLSKHLHVIFTLNKVLELPIDKLVEYLQACPDVNLWTLTVCSECDKLVADSKKVYQELLEVQRRFAECQQKIIRVFKEAGGGAEIKLGYNEKRRKVAVGSSLKPLDLACETRKFVLNHKYLAEKLNDAAPEESYYSPKREPPDDGEVANDVDIDWIPNAAESDRDSGSESESAHDEDSNPLKVDNDCNSSESEKEDDTPIKRKFTPSKPGQFYCNLCLARKNTKRKKYTSLNLQDFLKHYIYHKRLVYKCTECDRRVMNREDCNLHFKNRHKLSGFNISTCLKPGGPTPLPEIPWWCSHCDAHFIDEDKRDEHQRQQHSQLNNPLELPQHLCKFCNKHYTSADELQLHEATKHSAEKQLTFECNLCSEIYITKQYILRHKARYHSEQPKVLNCPKCGILFCLQTKLDHHLETFHNEVGTISCEFCAKLFISEASLNLHVNTTHSTNIEPLKKPVKNRLKRSEMVTCETCGKKWNPKTLKWHQYKAHNIGSPPPPPPPPKEYVCKHCEKPFTREAELNQHIFEKHDPSILAPFICEACGVGFFQQTKLTQHQTNSTKCQHLLRKTEEQPIVCHICGKIYTNARTLHIHVRFTHEQRFTAFCPVCDKGLASQRDVKRHCLRRHKANTKPKKTWTCPEPGCGKVFARRHRLRDHQLGVHKPEGAEPKFKCKECGKAYHAYCGLAQHRSLVHQGYKPKSKPKVKVVKEEAEEEETE